MPEILDGFRNRFCSFCHFDGHGHKLAQEPAAAAHHAAAPHRAEHLRLVPDADLTQFDAGVVLAHQILYQLTKVDPGRGGKSKTPACCDLNRTSTSTSFMSSWRSRMRDSQNLCAEYVRVSFSSATI